MVELEIGSVLITYTKTAHARLLVAPIKLFQGDGAVLIRNTKPSRQSTMIMVRPDFNLRSGINVLTLPTLTILLEMRSRA